MKKNITNIIELLKQEYPEATCSLDFTSPWEMAIAVVLSAQCTDERVNKITPNIFAKYKTPKDFNNMDITRRTCGYLGKNNFNQGRIQEIKERVLHL